MLEAKKGAYKDMYPEDLLSVVLKEVVQRTKIDPKESGSHVGDARSGDPRVLAEDIGDVLGNC